MILRKDNPHFVDYVSEFNNTVNMFMLKPEHYQGGSIPHKKPGEGSDAPAFSKTFSKAVPSRPTVSASLHPCGFIPAKTILARALMPRQPYSVAVKSDGEERLHPLSPEGKGAWGKRWSPL